MVGELKGQRMIETIAVIDFEASGLGPESWPVEVGVSLLLDGKAITWSSLIRPAADWGMDAWDDRAEEIHGISAEELSAAPTARDVVSQLLRIVGSRQLLADAPAFDRFWMGRLFEAAWADPVPDILDYNRTVAAIFADDPARLDRAYERLTRRRPAHRAGADAERLLQVLL